MALHWPTFLTRTGSAVVFAAVMLVGLLVNGWAYAALVAVIMVLCLRDYFRLMEKLDGEPVTHRLQLAVYGLGFLTLLLIVAGLLSAHGERTAGAFAGWRSGAFRLTMSRTFRYAGLLLTPIFLTSTILIFLYAALSKNSTLRQGWKVLTGILYINIPAALLIYLNDFDPAWPLVLIVCIWTNDTMAYIVGSLIGRTPFSPISPKKTWEGTAGGAILTVGGAALWAWLSGYLPMLEVIGVALCAAVFGTLGDLFESKLKRLAGVKDSGALMPGHGGALDRFDSLLVAAPFAFCYLWIVRLCA